MNGFTTHGKAQGKIPEAALRGFARDWWRAMQDGQEYVIYICEILPFGILAAFPKPYDHEGYTYRVILTEDLRGCVFSPIPTGTKLTNGVTIS
jgi:hypothetical protein